MFKSIRWRLVISTTLITLLAVLLVGALTLSMVRQYMLQREQASLNANARAIARQVELLLGADGRSGGLDPIVATASFLTDAQVRVFDGQRQVLADSGAPGASGGIGWLVESAEFARPGGPRFENLPRFVLPLTGDRGDQDAIAGTLEWSRIGAGSNVIVVERSQSLWGTQLRFTQPLSQATALDPNESELENNVAPASRRSAVSAEVAIGDSNDPVGYVELSNRTTVIDQALDPLRNAFLIAGVSVTALAAVVGFVVAGGLTGPLRALTTAASRMSDGDLSARAPVGGEDEIGTLALQFNRMADTIQASFASLASERDALRHFIADASHELRTPLTALQTYNELLQQEAGQDESLRAEFLQASAEQLKRVIWLTHNLLDLSRYDAGLYALERTDVDLVALLQDMVAAFGQRAHERGISLVTVLPEEPTMAAVDPERLGLAVSNLVDNAVRYAPYGGHVTVGLRRHETGLALWVQDDGPGVPPEHLSHVFKRFHRAGRADESGMGLGLAIAQSIVRAHGGEIAIDNVEPTGAKATISLPNRNLPDKRAPLA